MCYNPKQYILSYNVSSGVKWLERLTCYQEVTGLSPDRTTIIDMFPYAGNAMHSA